MLKNRLAVMIASIVLLVAGSLTALAQGLVTQKLISADQANTIARGAVDKCRADGYHVTVTVIDEDGLLKAFLRDDGSAPHTIDFSRKKAFSALTFRRTSAETGKAWAENPPAPNVDGTTGREPISRLASFEDANREIGVPGRTYAGGAPAQLFLTAGAPKNNAIRPLEQPLRAAA
jgi:uncharacterized protein GlcG (DUF336 family)